MPLIFDQIDQTLLQYRKRLSGADSDIRELIAAVDFHVRIAYTLIIAASGTGSGPSLRASPMPGFGTMLAVLSTKNVNALNRNDPVLGRIAQLAENVRTTVESCCRRSKIDPLSRLMPIQN
ncbi:MAG TPA: hypothetical protein PK743_00845, partial [Luteimonas sp.]|nr:hypothetical protein [Luteimonas sp.]HRP71171.1 hypothetical protein [Luteimonas sp.]